jgi:putative DNA primase/helicase
MENINFIVTQPDGLIDPDNANEKLQWYQIVEKLKCRNATEILLSFGTKLDNIKHYDFRTMDVLMIVFNKQVKDRLVTFFHEYNFMVFEGNDNINYNMLVPLDRPLSSSIIFNSLNDILMDGFGDEDIRLDTYFEHPMKDDFYVQENKGRFLNPIAFMKINYKKKLSYVVPMGFDMDKKEYLFYSKTKNSFVGIPFERVNKNMLKVLCSQNDFWEYYYPSSDPKQIIDWEFACDELRNICDSKGKIDISNGKRNGIWEDNGKLVVHLGDKLLVDGEEKEIYEYRGEHFYDFDHKISWEGDSITPEEVDKMETYFDMFNFKTNKDKMIVMGTIIPAFLTGILSWRPYLHIGGVNGSGKSTVANNMLRPLFNVFKNKVALNATSAAGIQQEYKNRANVLLFDEFKSTGEHGRSKIDGILELARAAASGKDGVIIKGTSGGKANKISLDCFFITNATMFPAKDVQDKDRFNIVELEKLENENSKIESTLLDHFTPKLGLKIMKRAAKIHKEFLESAAILEEAFRKLFPDVTSRNARKLMLPLSGLYHLRHDDIITPQSAEELIGTIDFTTDTQKTIEEIDCFADTMQKFMDHPLNIRGNESSIRGWLYKLITNETGSSVDGNMIKDTLLTNGLMYKDNFLWFRINNQSLHNIFSIYGYESHRPIISRLEGFVTGKPILVDGKTQRFDGIPYVLEEGQVEPSLERDVVFEDHSIDFS